MSTKAKKQSYAHELKHGRKLNEKREQKGGDESLWSDSVLHSQLVVKLSPIN
jgi:hypothetical protein